MFKKASLVLFIVAMLLGLVGGIGSSTTIPTTVDRSEAQDDIIFIGSKDFTEAEILSWVVYLVLENEGYRVIDQMRSAPTTSEVRQALLDGDIDAYVEYTATGVLLLAADNEDVSTDAAFDANTAFTTVSLFDQANNDLTWLQPAPANNTYGLAVTEDFANENNMETLEDLALYINTGNDVVVTGNNEFFDRPDAFPSFVDTYGFEISEEDGQINRIEPGQPPQTLLALETGQDDTNVAMAYGTTGELLVGEFVMLEDTLGAQPVYAPAPVFRGEIIRNNPQIVALLQPVFSELNNRTLQNLNVSVTRFGDTPREAAQRFLEGIGILDGNMGNSCIISRPSNEEASANLRGEPNLGAVLVGSLSSGASVTAVGQYKNEDDGFTWYRLELGPWVREDVVEVEEACADLPEIEA